MGHSMMVGDVRLETRFPTKSEGVLVLLLYVLYRIIRWGVWQPLTSPLRRLQLAPEGRGWNGHQDSFNSFNASEDERYAKWQDVLGQTFAIKGYFWVHRRLYTVDPRAMSHTYGNTHIYGKSPMSRRVLEKYMRKGMLPAEGERHRIQRKVAAKMFSGSGLKSGERQMAELMDVLRDQLHELATNAAYTTPYSRDDLASRLKAEQVLGNGRIVDPYRLTCRITWDAIGQTLLGHSFEALAHPEGPGGVLCDKYSYMQSPASIDSTLKFTLSSFFPWIDNILSSRSSRAIVAALDGIDEVANRLREERTREALDGKADKTEPHDLMSLMVAHNLNPATKPEDKLLDSEFSGQLATAAFAGTDTTSSNVAYTMRYLALNPDIQQRVRNECLAFGENAPFEQLDTLPMLNAVIRESIRIAPPGPVTMRQAFQDDVIPLAKPILDRYGKEMTEVKIRKGQTIYIHMRHYNKATALWGPDAATWDPLRWLDVDRKRGVPDYVPDGPGVWPNVLTFGDGPRRCLGYRLWLIEVKMIIFALVRGYVWEPIDGLGMYRAYMFTMRPMVEGEFTQDYSMPLIMRPYKGE